MTQENKDLLFIDICARIPYGVKVKTEDGKHPLPFTTSHLDFYRYSIEDIKPYLFPMSSMTEEQEKELITITDGKFRYMWGTITNAIPRKNISEWGTSENAFIDDIKVINSLYIWLLKNHFDIYGLIPKGLAEDATDKNIY